ncbi:MAG TPA: DUF4190 domain-containing protein [Pirellulales bacterium]
MAPGVHFCGGCGEPLLRSAPPAASGDMGQDAGMRLLLPVGRSILAIISGYLGLLSVLLVPAPFALLTGILAIREIRRNPAKHGMGRAIFGVVMGTLGTALLLLLILSLAFTSGTRH